MKRTTAAAFIVTLLAMFITSPAARAEEIIVNYFYGTWARTDKPVADQMVNRTWMWGPGEYGSAVLEGYAESPQGFRLVQYFDKSRMEITHPNGGHAPGWYVTNGLLVVELVTGRMQIGDNAFESGSPAEVNVAGDPDDSTGPTYALFGTLTDDELGAQGDYIGRFIDRDGSVGDIEFYRMYAEDLDVRDAWYVTETAHYVASPFWEFMNSEGLVYEYGILLQIGWFDTGRLFENPFYATGYPITDAYWAEVKVAGVYRNVLIQCFERRCLTYTPDNPAGWQVEAGNVGQHYYRWRYGDETPPTAPTANLEIVELNYTLPGFPDDSPENESVVVRNNEPHPVSMSGWSFWDGDNQFWYVFPDIMLGPGGSITIHNCAGTNTAADLYAGYCQTWIDGGDYYLLLDPNLTVVDYEWRSLQ